MKKWIYSAAVGLTVLGLSACGGTGSSESTAAESVEIPNPMKEAESSQELSEIGVSMEAPAEGTDVQYYIIRDRKSVV